VEEIAVQPHEESGEVIFRQGLVSSKPEELVLNDVGFLLIG
jgi:hypothetical protein